MDKMMLTSQPDNTTPTHLSKKKPTWFKHDTDASTDEKILQLRAVGGWQYVGLWWALVELLSQQDSYAMREKSFPGTAVYLAIPLDEFKKFLEVCVEAELLKIKDGFIFSSSLRNRLLHHDEISEIRTKAAKSRTAKQELASNPPQSTSEQMPSKCLANAQQMQNESSASLLSSLILSNLFLSKFFSDPSFSEGGGLKNVVLTDLSAEQVLSSWLSAGLEKSDLKEGLRAYDAWKGKKCQMGQQVWHDDAGAMCQPWVKTEAMKLKNEMAKLARTRGTTAPKTINWENVFKDKSL